MICNKDCFNCIFPDCINDTFDQADYDDLIRIDRMLFPEYYTEAAIRLRERHKRNEKRRAHRRKSKYDPAKRKESYERNKERALAYQRDYHLVNGDEENRKKREHRATKRRGGAQKEEME